MIVCDADGNDTRANVLPFCMMKSRENADELNELKYNIVQPILIHIIKCTLSIRWVYSTYSVHTIYAHIVQMNERV